jgi:WD40 repeat protein
MVDGVACHPARKAHARTVRSVAFSPDGKRIASGGDDQMLKILDFASVLAK